MLSTRPPCFVMLRRALIGLFCEERWGATDSFCQNGLLGSRRGCQRRQKRVTSRAVHVTCVSVVMSIISRIKQDDRPEVTHLLYRKWALPECLQMHCDSEQRAADQDTNWRTAKPLVPICTCISTHISQVHTRAAAISGMKRVKQGRRRRGIIIIIIIINVFSLIIRRASSGKSRYQQDVKAIYPTTLWIMCAVHYYYYYYHHYHHHHVIINTGSWNNVTSLTRTLYPRGVSPRGGSCSRSVPCAENKKCALAGDGSQSLIPQRSRRMSGFQPGANLGLGRVGSCLGR